MQPFLFYGEKGRKLPLYPVRKAGGIKNICAGNQWTQLLYTLAG